MGVQHSGVPVTLVAADRRMVYTPPLLIKYGPIGRETHGASGAHGDGMHSRRPKKPHPH